MLSHTIYLNHSSLPWVTFIDGAGGIFSLWEKQLPEFKLHYNILVIGLKDLESPLNSIEDLRVEAISTGILHVLDYRNIDRSHFIGLSLGTVFIKNFALKYPNRIESMILAGAIAKINYRLRFLFQMQKWVKTLFSFSTQFNFFTYLLLPNRNHKESREFLKEQSINWNNEEFLKWVQFTKKLNPVLKYLYSEQTNVPSLYVMGEEDRLFLPAVKKMAPHNSGSLLFIIQDCGHLVNIEQAVLFNKMVIGYLVGFEGVPLNNRIGIESSSKCSPEEVLIANSNNHSKK
ncbi:alpha/beta hydrolase [Maribacter litopenaei]|uniref:Alpha/beta hydrolase n=1 Tax=Maribacter litopenaei TaxID=2976127 RepID=A0ABY5YD48_9FLAO|nr:alpha/beta hydrolase [Maribacter litopenaei]UWX55801.1 alpha/beta hydrolase [Maribacter litopenaei]